MWFFLYKHFSEIKVQFFILGFSNSFSQNILYECIRVRFGAAVATKMEQKLHKYTFIRLSNFNEIWESKTRHARSFNKYTNGWYDIKVNFRFRELWQFWLLKKEEWDMRRCKGYLSETGWNSAFPAGISNVQSGFPWRSTKVRERSFPIIKEASWIVMNFKNNVR